MKKIVFIVLTIFIVLGFAGCAEKTGNMKITEWTPSAIYTDEEIEDAIDVVCVDFRHFRGAKLETITYAGDDVSNEYIEWATKYEFDQTLVLTSRVKTSKFVSDFEKNTTYEDFKWILIRKDGGKWSHVAHEF